MWFLLLIVIVWQFVCYWQIAKKAGYSGWWSLLMIIPFVGLVIAWIFPFMDWPVLARRRHASQGVTLSSNYPSPKNPPHTPVTPVPQTYIPTPSCQSTTNQNSAVGVVTPTTSYLLAFDVDAIYEAVANEMDSGEIDKGLWTRLFAELDGDEKKTKVAYIKQRAERLITLYEAQMEQVKQDNLARERILREEESRKALEARRVQEHLQKQEADRNQKQAAVRLAKFISENPGAHMDTKIQLIKLLGGNFKWDEGIFTFACTATLFGQEYKFKHNKLFEEWVVGQVVQQALIQE